MTGCARLVTTATHWIAYLRNIIWTALVSCYIAAVAGVELVTYEVRLKRDEFLRKSFH